MRENTVRVIQAYHDGWSAEDGACEPCWKSFRDASRALNLLKQVKRQRIYEWQAAEPAGRQPDPAILRLNFR